MTFEVRELYKHFGAKQVLEGVGFGTSSGRALGLLGRNGAGKTTTIRIIMNVFPADSGEILIDGVAFHRDELRVGYLPEEHGLYPKVPVRDQLVYLGKLRGMTGRDAKASAIKWLDRLGMREYEVKKLDTLSKGNQQKIQLAAALVTNPDLIILDEPFSGLDPVNAVLLKDVVKELIAQGRIVLFSSHQMNYVEEFCDSIAILDNGKITLAGSITEIKRSYDRSLFVVHTSESEALTEYCRSAMSGWLNAVTIRDGAVFIHMKEEKMKSDVMGRLASSGRDIDSIAVYEPSLSDIFVHTVGDDEPEEVQHETA